MLILCGLICKINNVILTGAKLKAQMETNTEEATEVGRCTLNYIGL